MNKVHIFDPIANKNFTFNGCAKLTYSVAHDKKINLLNSNHIYLAYKDGSLSEKIQCLIDTCPSLSEKPLRFKSSEWLTHPSFSVKDKLSLFNREFHWESPLGHYIYSISNGMIIRFLELISQGIQQKLLSSKFNINPTLIKIIATTIWLGLFINNWPSIILANLIPIGFQLILSFKHSNTIHNINTLSSYQDFNTKDFLLKNILNLIIKIIPTIILCSVMCLKGYTVQTEVKPTILSYCMNKDQSITAQAFSITKMPSGGLLQTILLEPTLYVIGKMLMDITWIAAMKLINCNADLRDPFGFLCNWKKLDKKTQFKTIDSPKTTKQKTHNNKIINESEYKYTTSSYAANKEEKINYPTNNKKRKNKQEITTHKTETKTPQQQLSYSIKHSGTNYNFVKVTNGHNDNLWMVISCNSLTEQEKTIYEKKISNGRIGANCTVRTLKNNKNCYEVESGEDPRLIGKKYENGIFNALKNTMPYEKALVISQKLTEANFTDNDNISLIIFSKEAKKHNEIHNIAQKL